MTKSYLKIAFRSISKSKMHSIINISGLAIGMTAFLLLMLWLQDELSYDRYHHKANRIYRVIYQSETQGNVRRMASTPAPLGPALVKEFPEVQQTVRFANNRFLFKYKERMAYEEVFFADPEIFDVFTLLLVKGNPRTALREPNSIIISTEIRDKYFPGEEPIGKIIQLEKIFTLKITGVFEDIPHNSHFRFKLLGQFSSYAGKNIDQWGMANYYTYILTSTTFSPGKFQEKLPEFVGKYRGNDLRDRFKISYPLQPLTQIHLHSHLLKEIEYNRDIGTVYIFSLIALFILLIACLNYINLSTAIHIGRTREVGLRKVLGATRSQLIKQFLFESYLLSIIAVPFSLLLLHTFLPTFNSLFNKQLTIAYFDNLFLLPGLLAITMITGIISGLFPALIISAYHPIIAIKGISKAGSRLPWLRQALVVFQFAVSIVFMVLTILFINQLQFMRHIELGFHRENIVYIPIYESEALENYETIKNELLKNANIRDVSASNFFPGQNVWNINYWREGMEPTKHESINCIDVDNSFIAAFGIQLIEGENFSQKPPTVKPLYILNETAVKTFEWQSPIGKRFELGGLGKGTVIGVVRDFHFEPLQAKIRPTVLYFEPRYFSYFSIRINPAATHQTLEYIKNKFRELVPQGVFEYTFLDEALDSQYISERRLGKILLIVSGFSIFIACLGLFGLVSFITENRTKEIGIRKVFGASVRNVVILLAKEFTRWVLVANIIAWPIAWVVGSRWMEDFAYRSSISILTFLAAGFFSLFIVWITTGYHSVKAAAAPPINTLRYE